VKTIALKKPSKNQRERLVLLKLVELYIKSGSPIGSQTLKEQGFKDLSSATIRNYFGKLEEEGFLMQQHSSGGRIPTEKGYRLFAESYFHQKGKEGKGIDSLNLDLSNKEVASFLQKAAEIISNTTSCAVFISAPRFDRDFVLRIQLVQVEENRLLAILLTDFGLIHTEVLFTKHNLSLEQLKRLEHYFAWRLSGKEKLTLSKEEEDVALNLYNEVMLRHIVRYSNFNMEDTYKTGFATLLNYPELNEPSILANALSLFENPPYLRQLLRKTTEEDRLSFWIGSDLGFLSSSIKETSVIAIPYKINEVTVGAIALLGPMRISYHDIFTKLKGISEEMSTILTSTLYKFKISYRQPKITAVDHKNDPLNILDQTQCLLLDNKHN